MKIFEFDENVVALGKKQVDLCNSLENVAYAPKELVASFKLLVLEEEIGAWGIIETKAQKATDTEGDISSNNERNLKIIIGGTLADETESTHIR